MALPSDLTALEESKFQATSAGSTAVRVIITDNPLGTVTVTTIGTVAKISHITTGTIGKVGVVGTVAKISSLVSGTVKSANPGTNFSTIVSSGSIQTAKVIVAAGGAGTSHVITDLAISIAGTAATITVVESTGTTPVAKAGPFYFAANGGCVCNLKTPITLTANKSLGYTCSGTVRHSVQVVGYSD